MWSCRSQPAPGVTGLPLPRAIASEIANARAGGRPLDRPTCDVIGTMLGWDIGCVRVHTDQRAAALAEELDAQAFAVGSHIFFASGAYDPDSAGGRALIAHEAVHVVQQCTGRVRGVPGTLTVLPAGHSAETEADLAALASLSLPGRAQRVHRAGPLRPLSSALPPTVLQRNVGRFVDAARTDPFTQDSRPHHPRNCHEAVLGWLLVSLGYPKPWRLLRLLADRLKVKPNLEGHWMVRHIYQRSHRVTQDIVYREVNLGDILCVGSQGLNPQHSMAVVGKGYGGLAPMHEVIIRGFNNAGSFLHEHPPPPQGLYDPVDRNVADPRHWAVQPAIGNVAKFGASAGADLFVVRYGDAAEGAARMFPWESAEIPSHATPRWHYNILQGWRFF